MEVILKTIKRSLVDVLVKKVDGLCRQTVLLGLVALHYELELLTLLVVLELLLRIDIFVVYLKHFVLEVLLNLEACFQVNWCLRVAIANDAFATLIKPAVVGGHPVVLGEFARSLV